MGPQVRVQLNVFMKAVHMGNFCRRLSSGDTKMCGAVCKIECMLCRQSRGCSSCTPANRQPSEGRTSTQASGQGRRFSEEGVWGRTW